MATALIVDDDRLICHAIRDIAAGLGHEVTYALTLRDGLRQIVSKEFDIVFLDVRLPDGNGLHKLSQFSQVPPFPEVIIITGEGSPDGAECAIKGGAWDYIEKPLGFEQVRLPLMGALQYRKEKKIRRTPSVPKRHGIVGSSLEIKRCLDIVAQSAGSETSILLTGETGTGKELFARAIHENSMRSAGSFVVIDCAALPETLVESILFGHKKGAFTGADRCHNGLVKQAHGGTLFLDEVGELPLSIQKKFLRVLEDKHFRPVGGTEELKSDFRLVSATNRDLDKMVKAGKFRKDLLFRIRSTAAHLPPLRERKDDIKDIATYYAGLFSERYGKGAKKLSPEFIGALNSYNWPGNVRQLALVLESALSKADTEPTLFPIHLPDDIRTEMIRFSVGNGKRQENVFSHSGTMQIIHELPKFREWLNESEKQYLQHLTAYAGGDISEACRISGMPRSSLYYHLKKYDIRLGSA